MQTGGKIPSTKKIQHLIINLNRDFSTVKNEYYLIYISQQISTNLETVTDSELVLRVK